MVGAEEIIEHALEWLSAFPGTNEGHSRHGPPTGRELTRENSLSIHNCLIERVDGRWRYAEEWSSYDTEAREWACAEDVAETDTEA